MEPALERFRQSRDESTAGGSVWHRRALATCHGRYRMAVEESTQWRVEQHRAWRHWMRTEVEVFGQASLVVRAIATAFLSRNEGTDVCYCNRTEDKVLEDLRRGVIPDDALVRSCCGRWVCRVRGRHFNEVDPETWREIGTKRGYVLSRENPRGF